MSEHEKTKAPPIPLVDAFPMAREHVVLCMDQLEAAARTAILEPSLDADRIRDYWAKMVQQAVDFYISNAALAIEATDV